MGKQKKMNKIQNNNSIVTGHHQKKEPLFTHKAYKFANITIIIGFFIQLILASISYKNLDTNIPTSWIGIGSATQMMPSWIVFIAYPGSQLILYLIAYFSRKDNDGKKIMDWGKSITLILLTILFTALQESAFYIQK